MMQTTPLTRELISDPSLWRLSLELCPDALEVVILSSLEDNSLLHRRLPLDPSKGYIEALEDVIYDNPLLLSDFGRVDVLISSPRYMLVPNEVAAVNDDAAEDIMQVLWPQTDYEVLSEPLASTGETLICGIDRTVLALVRRTFPECRISHRLVPMIKYFCNKGRLANTSTMYVHLQASTTDIIYIKDGRLAMVNTFDTPTVTDALFYIMTAVRAVDFDRVADRLMLCGSTQMREGLAPLLRKYVEHVMPVVYPSAMLSAGPETMQAPFELIVLPICE